MLSISPIASIAINGVLLVLTGLATTSGVDPSVAKYAGGIVALFNLFLHSTSSATAGPLASTPPAAK